MKILVIEDDFSHFHMIKMAIKYAMDRPVAVDNALKLNDAIKFMSINNYDLIISDLFLPYSSTLMNTIENVVNNKKDAIVVFCSAVKISESELEHLKSKNWEFFAKDEKFSDNLRALIEEKLK